ncbi:hypothetical protein EDC01DRAFT_212168 [Geopyxis carbonaria]|nr:hypothetical protein EDC01DRAFT_212168 [Geopyxis carbonaria]
MSVNTQECINPKDLDLSWPKDDEEYQTALFGESPLPALTDDAVSEYSNGRNTPASEPLQLITKEPTLYMPISLGPDGQQSQQALESPLCLTEPVYSTSITGQMFLPDPMDISEDLIDPSLLAISQPTVNSVPIAPTYQYNEQQQRYNDYNDQQTTYTEHQIMEILKTHNSEPGLAFAENTSIVEHTPNKRRTIEPSSARGTYQDSSKGSGSRSLNISPLVTPPEPNSSPFSTGSNKRKHGGSSQSTSDPHRHSRAPLEPGLVIPPSRRELGKRISDWNPQPYLGPAARPICTVEVETHVNNDRGGWFTYTGYEALPHFGPFKYTRAGDLDPKVLFDEILLGKFIKWHPLGKNLQFRIQKNPQKSIGRRPYSCYNHCRAQNCHVDGRGRHIKEGAIVVAAEEVWGRIPRRLQDTVDPYHSAFYLHLECLENLIDIGQLIQHGMLRTFPRRQLAGEPRTSNTEPNKLCLPEKTDNCFKRFYRRVLDEPTWNGYRKNVLESLITKLWLTNTRKDKHLLGVRPHQKEITEEIGYRMSVNKGRDPGWGGSRFVGLSVSQADKIVASHGPHIRNQLMGSKRDAAFKNQQILMNADRDKEILAEQFSDGEEFRKAVGSTHCSVRETRRRQESPPQYNSMYSASGTQAFNPMPQPTGPVRRSPRRSSKI